MLSARPGVEVLAEDLGEVWDLHSLGYQNTERANERHTEKRTLRACVYMCVVQVLPQR